MKRFIKYLIMALLTFSSFGLLFYTFKLNVLNIKSFILLSMAIVFIWAILFLILLKSKKTGLKVFIGIISLLFIFVYGIGARYISKTVEYINKATNIKYETINYKVLTLKSNDINEILDLTDKNIGFMSTDKYLDKSTKKLEKRLDFEDKTYEEIGTLIGSLYEGKVEAIVVSDSYLELLEENNVEFTLEDKEVYSYSIRVIKTKEDKKVDVTKDTFIMYISGSDSRGSVSDVARSDVNIVAVVNPTKRKVLLVSIPRDYYVQLHGTTGVKDKLTHAGVYGIDMSINTIEDLLGIDINYYTKVSFNTVVKIVDTIDGIDINSDTEFTGSKNCHYVVGEQHLNGECALRYARERKIYESGDRHRGQNQQAVITAIINKMTNPKYLIRYDKILKNTEGTFETNMSYDEITNLAKYELTDLKKWSVESYNLDGTGDMQPTYSMGDINLYVMQPDMVTVKIAQNKINEYLEK
ncbi:MAG: LCP family protein [Bacilli bacterium]|nr:LCP family protein [Bacilli bacterium]